MRKKIPGEKKVFCSGLVYVKKIGAKGRGVFAAQKIGKGTMIEECEVLFFQKKEIPYLKKTLIDSYYYCWRGGAAVLPLGFGPFYNHSSQENAEWKNDYNNRRMALWALCDVKKDEEIMVNYNLPAKELWFQVIE